MYQCYFDSSELALWAEIYYIDCLTIDEHCLDSVLNRYSKEDNRMTSDLKNIVLFLEVNIALNILFRLLSPLLSFIRLCCKVSGVSIVRKVSGGDFGRHRAVSAVKRTLQTAQMATDFPMASLDLFKGSDCPSVC